jgi:hypothetical protein
MFSLYPSHALSMSFSLLLTLYIYLVSSRSY